jgi:membrane associated rhomboid family serine protease
MSLKTSKRILKIFGIFDIICGIFLIILGVMVLVGASQLSPEEIASDPSLSAGVSGMAIFFILGLLSLLEGIFSIRGAKDAAKIMPAWIFAIIGVIAAVVGLFTGGSLGGSIFSLIVNIVIFIAANKIRKSRISS